MSHTSHSNHPHDRTAEARLSRADMQRRKQASREERERLLDDELDDTFPASDPPSWTMGGSIVSALRH